VSTSWGLYARFPRIDAAAADGWCWRAEVKVGGHAGGRHCRSRWTRNGARDAGRGRVWVDLVAAAALACSVLASLALALHAASTAEPRHWSCQAL